MNLFLNTDWFSLLLASWYAKGVIIMAIALVTILIVRRRSPRLAAGISIAAILSTLALPLMSLLLPQWQVEVPGWQAGHDGINTAPVSVAATDERPPTLALPRAARGRAEGTSAVPADRPPVAHASRRNGNLMNRVPGAGSEDSASPRLSPTALFLIVWLIGVLLVMDRQLKAFTELNRVVRRARPATRDAYRALAQCARNVGLRRAPKCVISRQIKVPLVCGWRRPVVLLPESARFWSRERLQIILTHELCHLRRGDWPLQQIARLCCALNWANPFIWWLERQLHLQRERACDADVVDLGASANRYAEHLVAIARRVIHTEEKPMMAPAAVGGSDLEERIMSLIDGRKLRQSTLFTVTTGALLGATLAACAAVNPVPEAEASPAPESAPAAPAAPAATTRPARPARPAPAADVVPPRPAKPTRPAPPAPDGHEHHRLGDGLSLTVNSDGGVGISGDPLRIANIEPGGWFEIKTRDRDHSNALRASADGRGGIEYRWMVDGQVRDFDTQGERWLSAALDTWQRVSRAQDIAQRMTAKVQARMSAENGRFAETQARIAAEMAQINLEDEELQALMAEVSEEGAKLGMKMAELGPEQEELASIASEMAQLALAEVNHLGEFDEARHEELQRQLEQRTRQLEERARQMEQNIDETRLKELEAKMQARMAEINYEEKARQLDAKAKELEQAMRDSGFEESMREMEAELAELELDADFDEVEDVVEELRAAMNATR